MRLYYWRDAPNFGDELNTMLWPRLLPDFFDDDPREIFIGIGSVLDSRHPPGAHKIVAGAGYGGYEPPARLDPSWTIHWVRGPRTARQLALPPACGIGDPASLIDRTLAAAMLGAAWQGRPETPSEIGFMPHFETAERGVWARVAQEAGMTLIDPRADPRAVLAAIARCRVLVSEALHGVIVADALRVPWVAAAPFVPIHAAKWDDWGSAMGIAVVFERLLPSSFLEQVRLSRLAERRMGRRLVARGAGPLRAFGADRFAGQAAAALRRAAQAPPRLTTDRALDRSRDRMLTALEGVRPRMLAG
jgi:succinoglycan biosynthesis protein ExoV